MSAPGQLPLDGRLALVTGSASGIGLACAAALARSGAAPLLLDRCGPGVRAASRTLAGPAGPPPTYTADVSRAEDLDRVVAEISQRHGRLDILVNCAGIIGPRAALDEMDEAALHSVLAVNLNGLLALTARAIPLLKRSSHGGRIVNISSASASRSRAYSVAYASSKAGVEGATRALAGELAPFDINVNAVAPGVTATGIHGAGDTEEDRTRRASQGATANLFNRPSQPEDIAQSVVFLCTPATRQITGQVIHVSAGAIV